MLTELARCAVDDAPDTADTALDAAEQAWLATGCEPGVAAVLLLRAARDRRAGRAGRRRGGGVRRPCPHRRRRATRGRRRVGPPRGGVDRRVDRCAGRRRPGGRGPERGGTRGETGSSPRRARAASWPGCAWRSPASPPSDVSDRGRRAGRAGARGPGCRRRRRPRAGVGVPVHARRVARGGGPAGRRAGRGSSRDGGGTAGPRPRGTPAYAPGRGDCHVDGLAQRPRRRPTHHLGSPHRSRDRRLPPTPDRGS